MERIIARLLGVEWLMLSGDRLDFFENFIPIYQQNARLTFEVNCCPDESIVLPSMNTEYTASQFRIYVQVEQRGYLVVYLRTWAAIWISLIKICINITLGASYRLFESTSLRSVYSHRCRLNCYFVTSKFEEVGWKSKNYSVSVGSEEKPQYIR